ncbi:MAG: nickel pincer cofactor biosynthesis protein LarB [Victivallales bacterium]|nr:nickel pincer cofactor biosynthesis protein LarB [Victivallales bacterium]
MSDKLKTVLKQLEDGKLDLLSAMLELSGAHGLENPGFARIDHGRRERCGFPEFIYGAGKTVAQMSAIIRELIAGNSPVLVTRLDAGKGKALAAEFPEGEFDELAGVFRLNGEGGKRGKVLILTAGTSDLKVALEARYTLEACGIGAEVKSDVGVAGLHRLLSEVGNLKNADVIIVIAGMEGALPSVVGGLVSCPVIAVPASVGYGAALNGFAALLGMLNSCAGGLTVVNIDNGFGAACAAARIINSAYAHKKQ